MNASSAVRWLIAIVILAGLGAGVYLGYDHLKGLFSPPPVADKAPDAPAVVRVIVPLDGASAQQVEDTLTRPLERALAVISGVQNVQSRSLDGLSVITVTCVPGIDMFQTRQNATNATQAALNGLPEPAGEPRFLLGDPERLPIVWLTISNTRQPFAPVTSDVKTIRETLGSLIGRDVQIAGGRSRCLRVRLDVKRLTENRLLAADVTEAVRANVAANGGRSLPETVAALKVLELVKRDPKPLRLHDVAAVAEGAVDDGGFALLDGKPVVALGVHCMDEAADRNAAALHEKLPEVRAGLEEGEELAVAVDYRPTDEGGRSDEWLVELTFPAGTNGGKMAVVVREIDKQLRQLPAVARVLAVRPDLSQPGAGLHDCSLFIRLHPQTDSQRAEAGKQLRTTLDSFLDVSARLLDLAGQAPPPTRRYPFAVVVQGPDRKKVEAFANAVRTRLVKDLGLTGLAPSDRKDELRLTIKVDRAAATRAGVSVKQVQELLTISRQGIDLGSVRERRPSRPDRDWPVRLDMPGLDLATLKGLPDVALRSDDNRVVPLGDVLDIQDTSSVPVLLRQDLQPAVLIATDLAAGASADATMARCRELAEQVRQEMKLPAEYRLAPLGESRSANLNNPQ